MKLCVVGKQFKSEFEMTFPLGMLPLSQVVSPNLRLRVAQGVLYILEPKPGARLCPRLPAKQLQRRPVPRNQCMLTRQTVYLGTPAPPPNQAARIRTSLREGLAQKLTI